MRVLRVVHLRGDQFRVQVRGGELFRGLHEHRGIRGVDHQEDREEPHQRSELRQPSRLVDRLCI